MSRLSDFFQSVADNVQAFAEGLGGPGLAIVAFFDSSFVTLPEIADFLVVLFTIRAPASWYYFAAMTTVGSVTGSYTLFLIGRKGGDAILRRRVHPRHIDRGLGWFQRYGAFVLIIPSMLPPPMPFKAFVLLAGASHVRTRQFLAAVAFGRGLRYATAALLARSYGEAALTFLQKNVSEFFVPATAVVIALGIGLLGWRWARRRQTADVE